MARRSRLPDSPFFFTLYVGENPPTAFQFQQSAERANSSLSDVEDDFVARLNDARRRYDLSELRTLDDRQTARDLLAGAPEEEGPRYRYFIRASGDDPAPELPHGLWEPVWSFGLGASDAFWMALEHPISRGVLLRPDATQIKIGSRELQGYYWISADLIDPPPDGAKARELAREALVARWISPPPQPAPELEKLLDGVAQGIAGGDNVNKAIKGVVKLHENSALLGGGMLTNVFYVPPGSEPDVSTFQIPDGSKFLAIGQGRGDLGDDKSGIEYTVLMIVAAGEAQ